MTDHFHAFIRNRGRHEWIAVALDLSETEITRRVVKPYRRGKSLFVNGSVFKAEDIEAIRIVRTPSVAKDAIAELARQHNEFVDRINSDPTSGVVFIDIGPNSATDLVDEYDNVTDRFVNAPPGTSGFLASVWNYVTSNPLVSGVLATLLATALIAMLQRYL
jgi:hypothetical protein